MSARVHENNFLVSTIAFDTGIAPSLITGQMGYDPSNSTIKLQGNLHATGSFIATNNTYIKGFNNTATGTIDIIKVNSSNNVELGADINFDNLIQGNLYRVGASISVVDDDFIDLEAGTIGWGFAQIGDNEEYATFCWTSAGVVTLINNSTNAVNTDTDTKLCIFDNGSNVRIRNRLGSTKVIRYVVNYS